MEGTIRTKVPSRQPMLGGIWAIDVVGIAIMLVLILSFLLSSNDVRPAADTLGCDSLACIWP